ncbi:carboxymuconolactone decarboxylase family protein [Oceanobacillus sp. CFH 90083]|uniref:carboxymuconolactone decarboxylase family protein n=1 Tax=Oceanobacillus sp. CFH 90083 TaxID=2592336 RepID=UPI00128DA918|nr:carboxymuconolactone decarboxylase family protein [Oceanobacillus sp. CFH 90083]
MDNRINYFKVSPAALETIMESEKYVRKTSIDRKLKELIKIRVSQINGCSYCLNMHTKAAKKLKVSDEQINALEDWKAAGIFREEEQAALELAENMTLIAENGVSDALYTHVREYYNEKEYVELVMVILQINTWNRLSIAMGNHADV